MRRSRPAASSFSTTLVMVGGATCSRLASSPSVSGPCLLDAGQRGDHCRPEPALVLVAQGAGPCAPPTSAAARDLADVDGGVGLADHDAQCATISFTSLTNSADPKFCAVSSAVHRPHRLPSTRPQPLRPRVPILLLSLSPSLPLPPPLHHSPPPPSRPPPPPPSPFPSSYEPAALICPSPPPPLTPPRPRPCRSWQTGSSDVEAELHDVAVDGVVVLALDADLADAPWPCSTSRCRAVRPSG